MAQAARRGSESCGRRVRSLVSGTTVLALLMMLAATAMVGATPAVAQEDNAFLTATVAPDDALAYLAFTLDDESEQWQLGAELLERAGLGDTLDQAREDILTEAGTDTLPLDAFLGGQAAIIITDAALAAATDATTGLTGGLAGDVSEETPEPDDADPVPSGITLVLDARAPDTAFLGLIGAVEDQASESGAEVIESDYEGVEIRYAAASPDDSGTALAVARLDNDLILISGAPADLEPIIDTAAGSIPALSDFGPFADVRGALDGDFLFYSFVNGVAVGDAQAAVGTDPLGLGTAGTELTGVDQYIGLLMRADTPGFRMETVAIAGEGADLAPAADNFDPELLQQAPGDALFFMDAMDLGQTGVLDALGLVAILAASGTMGSDIATPTADTSQEDFIAQQYEEAAGLIGFNLQTDLFRQMIGEYALWITSDEDPSNITALFATGVETPDTVTNALNQLTLLVQAGGSGDSTVSTRDVDGSTINVVETGDTVPDVEYGVVAEQLLIGVGAAIDDFVGGPDEALADNEQFQAVLAELPEEHNGMLYVDLTQVVPLLQSLSASSGDGGDFEIEDASDECGDYETQEEAQAAYDEDTFANSELDQDFDGEACEDFFATDATPEATAEAVTGADYSAVTAFALVAFDEDGMRRSSSLLAIEE